MSRYMTPAVGSALESSNIPLLLLLELDFISGVLRGTNADCSASWNGYTWVPNLIGAIDAIKEGTTLEANGVGIELSGVTPLTIAIAMNENYQGRSAKIWVAPLTADYVPITDPVLIYVGRMDTALIKMGSMASVTIATENRLIDFDRARVRRFNSEDQNILYPTDLGFDYVPQLVEKQIKWGVA